MLPQASVSKSRYSDLNVLGARDGGLDVRFNVCNVGRAVDDEVPQVYLGPSPTAPAGVQQAVHKLVQFDRITLRPGEQRRLTSHVDARELSYWSTAQQRWIRGTGRHEAYLGSSSRDIREHTSAHIWYDPRGFEARGLVPQLLRDALGPHRNLGSHLR